MSLQSIFEEKCVLYDCCQADMQPEFNRSGGVVRETLSFIPHDLVVELKIGAIMCLT